MADEAIEKIVVSRARTKSITKKKAKQQAQTHEFRDLYISCSPDVSILFADIVGFTRLSGGCTAEELVKILNQLFGKFDELASVSVGCTCMHACMCVERMHACLYVC